MDNLARRETFSSLHPLQTMMRARVVWLEMSLILVALTFAELGEVLRELRTDVVLDWFVSLAPLIWINASAVVLRSEEHTSELQSLTNLVCRLLLEKKKR